MREEFESSVLKKMDGRWDGGVMKEVWGEVYSPNQSSLLIARVSLVSVDPIQ